MEKGLGIFSLVVIQRERERKEEIDKDTETERQRIIYDSRADGGANIAERVTMSLTYVHRSMAHVAELISSAIVNNTWKPLPKDFPPQGR